MQLVSHCKNFRLQRLRLPLSGENPLPDGFEFVTHVRVSRAIARAGERLVLPYPRAFVLVAFEGCNRGDEQPRGTARPELQVGLKENAGRGAAAHPGV